MQSVYMETFGCSAAQGESENILALLQDAGCEIVEKEGLADTIIVYFCSVKGPSENSGLRIIKKVKEQCPHKNIIATGCISKSIRERLSSLDPLISIVDTHNLDKIATALKEPGEQFICFSELNKAALPKLRKNDLVDIIPINSSCSSHCTFCATKLIKGKLVSYPEEDIITSAKKAIDEGVKEIWITSQDTICYGLDTRKKPMLPELIKRIASIEGDFMIRIGMMNPKHIPPIIEDIASMFNQKNVYKFLHIPIQSGNNRILGLMQRQNTREDVMSIIKHLRVRMPQLTIATDVICGFPSETEEEFSDTLSLLKLIEPDVVNFSRFWPRPGTIAAKMPQHQSKVIKTRSSDLTNFLVPLLNKRNEVWNGWQGEIMINELGKKGTMVGRNQSYKPVVVEGNYPLGKKIMVSIIGSTEYYLIGKET
ncbi:tRNA (N(6)-L-threonylcarbamoyladenosine(37)-C(2))-methylthiotransferase [Candidatus Woesearchaeota archaeon]|nr:MAG: MiaB-like protein tRNA modifying enzyme [archaeon GW2011_AR4]MBS3130743.1 tRNA (N(6)-L-threonylcarbamoyladenosine(37)-C(2))-methylthiotransferase [Candidatus Woesearchaeota archaeon]HIH38392.1 tRNA (N(6)-L-threonylcarbamoyladenosine(37)-C(2))-methylthiotransferase [Candidatus Woesearchaeota archaeon]HIH49629.1 tRNA (N(6)-L-threonylcarbamoyladenosine(37)-C(2))-methylthiotransferase [Candidatus Woesearchaeota archaeon]HIJ03084.1 tRNA (N(6)-L-threonylcarbamoyladenosine(37)-C(2))-methylthio